MRALTRPCAPRWLLAYANDFANLASSADLLTTIQYSANNGGRYGFESSIDRQLLNFIHLIDSKYISDQGESRPIDFAEKTQFFALDAICDISFGQAFGYLIDDKDLFRYIEINDSALPVMNMVSVLPWLGKLVHRWPFRLLLPKEGDKVGFGRLMGLVSTWKTEGLGC
jgi:hypothetical protein